MNNGFITQLTESPEKLDDFFVQIFIEPKELG
jgi:hypothetical protein